MYFERRLYLDCIYPWNRLESTLGIANRRRRRRRRRRRGLARFFPRSGSALRYSQLSKLSPSRSRRPLASDRSEIGTLLSREATDVAMDHAGIIVRGFGVTVHLVQLIANVRENLPIARL